MCYSYRIKKNPLAANKHVTKNSFPSDSSGLLGGAAMIILAARFVLFGFLRVFAAKKKKNIETYIGNLPTDLYKHILMATTTFKKKKKRYTNGF